ncbi:multidrug efflux SMR transporter [Brevibacterium sp. 50QC2O2]|uniref:DMT family transporter n=1 Tax=Brevibacterium sp. 50QC2O2 TaxID=2968459 RepID=UPI00211BD893|nr:multidrug efflux SMR transporter [Brevibacterium sp. 50QC2O2]MCQ9387170.1 multidrug efflux SMR transporter [Brevibacterium sp. 50QC2O2]
MKSWLFLCAAIAAEVVGTLALRASSEHAAWIALVVVAYVLAFTLIARSLRTGLGLTVVYGTWAAAGVVLVALLSTVVFAESLSPPAMVGIGLTVVGVVLVETGSGESETKDWETALDDVVDDMVDLSTDLGADFSADHGAGHDADHDAASGDENHRREGT